MKMLALKENHSLRNEIVFILLLSKLVQPTYGTFFKSSITQNDIRRELTVAIHNSSCFQHSKHDSADNLALDVWARMAISCIC